MNQKQQHSNLPKRGWQGAIKQRGKKQKQIKFILIEENNSPEPPIK